MMPSTFRLLQIESIPSWAGLLLLATPGLVCAEIYRCTNSEGKMLSADRIPPECRGRPIKVYSNTGSFKTEILPPPTAAERQEREKALERQKRELAENEERQKEARFLKAHFRDEDDIERARRKALEIVTAKRKMVEDQLSTLDALIQQLHQELARSKKDSGGLQSLASRADDLNRAIERNQTTLKLIDAEILRVNREFDQTRDRFRVVAQNPRSP